MCEYKHYYMSYLKGEASKWIFIYLLHSIGVINKKRHKTLFIHFFHDKIISKTSDTKGKREAANNISKVVWRNTDIIRIASLAC